jgi:hypothetical protein
METFNRQKLLRELAQRWPSNIVARTEIKVFTGGAITEGYIANLDSQGVGPEGRFRLGRKVVYPVECLVAWLESRAQNI